MAKYRNNSTKTIKKGDYVRLDPSRTGILPSDITKSNIIGIADGKILPRALGTFTPLGAGNGTVDEEDVVTMVENYLTENPPQGGLSIEEIKADEEIAHAISYAQNPPPATGYSYMPSGW